jgi:hypothetical protein
MKHGKDKELKQIRKDRRYADFREGKIQAKEDTRRKGQKSLNRSETTEEMQNFREERKQARRGHTERTKS